MKIQLYKCSFFKKDVDFLGFVISQKGIKTNQAKVEAIAKFPKPETLKQFRSFLGMSGYYRQFIRDCAKIAKPLTSLLRGEGGLISKNRSAKIEIFFDQKAIEAFNKIKYSLISEDVILSYSYFNKHFELVMAAINFALGAVLSQSGKLMAFISITLNKAEEHYAANEKEMLAIIWTLNVLRNYLYGSRKVRIHPDHQPLTCALSNNSKMKRWKANLEEYTYELFYKPNSDDSSSHGLICSIETLINAFKNQIFLNLDVTSEYQFKIVFSTYHRHIFTEVHYSEAILLNISKRYLNLSAINCIEQSRMLCEKFKDCSPFTSVNIR